MNIQIKRRVSALESKSNIGGGTTYAVSVRQGHEDEDTETAIANAGIELTDNDTCILFPFGSEQPHVVNSWPSPV